MACCALAAFLIGQMLMRWGKLQAWLGIAPADKMRVSAAWRLGGDAPQTPSTSRARFRLGASLAALGAIGLAGAAASQTNMVELGNTGIYAAVCGDITGRFGSE